MATDEAPGFQAYAHLLDARLLRALADLQYSIPTPVQRASLEESLRGGTRDIVARARTGSGKTLAYGLPVLQRILTAKSHLARSDPSYAGTRALVLVPTRELAEQVHRQLNAVLTYCRDLVQVANISRAVSASVQKLLLSEKPDVVVATPARALACLQSGDLSLQTSLQSLVIDEADLILSYGHDEEVQAIVREGFLVRAHQTFLTSATLSDDTSALRGLLLRDPVVLRLDDDTSLAHHLMQYYVETSEEQKFLLLYVILKLRLIRGKCLIFVNDIDRGYRVKLFLEQFGLRTCVLNEELPVNSRFHIVEEFNKGKYDYIIATDAHEAVSDDRRSGAGAREYGVSRGIDFVAVACVINFDLPTSVDAYTHRIGRTARAGHTGTALSFVVPRNEHGKKKALSCATCQHDEEVWDKIQEDQRRSGLVGATGIQAWRYDESQVDAFRYRMNDALRSVTKAAIKEARIQEIKNEILNSKALQAHFEANPRDLEYLRHDRALHPARVQAHMKHVPAYLRPRIAAMPGQASSSGPRVGYVPKNKPKGRERKTTRAKPAKKKKRDPLRTFT
ncbi:RNA helicase [Malassezia nana]|uniref:RNA helicase n=1 Tax=Malassezia nana TaxID=180528 RepID=A0AAF0EMS4_9BASI|nr:RNA helicase [Malassezia nana]